MKKRSSILFTSALVALVVLFWGTNAMAAATIANPGDPGGIPHYFGPYGNWAYSPLPKGPITAITLEEGGAGYTNPLVTVDDVYWTGSGAGAASAALGAGGAIVSIVGGLGGADYTAPTVTIVDDPALCGGAGQPVCGTGATASASISPLAGAAPPAPPGPAPTTQIIDNTDPGFAAIGAWTPSNGVPGFIGGDYLYASPGSGSASATWTFVVTTAGQYVVSAQWAEYSNRASNATYTVYNNAVTLGTVVFNQKINGAQFNTLGTYALTPGTLRVVLTDNASEIVVADAVKLASLVVGPPVGVTQTVDNSDPGFAAVGAWTSSNGVPGFSGVDYLYTTPGTGSMSATWTFGVTTAGRYDVSAQWTQDPNRAPNATYTVYNNALVLGTAAFDQRANGGQFNLLGTYTLAPGTLRVVLTNNASSYVVADAVRMVPLSVPGPAAGALAGGIRKFIDKLPGLGPAGANNIIQAHGAGQYIPVAVADTAAYPGPPASDYYEIALVEFSEKMHTDLPVTRLRGYVQLETPGALAAITAQGLPASKHISLGGGLFAIDNPHFLGATIVSTGNKPVRIKFYNLLPTGAGGDLFLPVDPTVMGSGMGPAGPGVAGDAYTQNRAAVHLHGNNTVWISDGTPHQWITPANETTPYPQGVSVRNVPDMNPASVDSPTDGMMTLYYTNAMSARLMFYHDHAMGITRLNVYAGNAAGYVITDQVDQDMVNGTNVSGVNVAGGTSTPFMKVLPDIGIPLVIQDRTFVDATTIWVQDPTWNWGTGPRDLVTGKVTAAVTGDLWYPHVYMSAQNPWDLTGTNAFGRWHYGPWFNPPVPTCVDGLPMGCIEVGPVDNPYYQPVCDGEPDPVNPVCTAPWEPPLMPGNPNPSMPGEAFMDTPIVNGTAYPYLDVEPKAYRFRILNAANDRFLNLQLYVAADKTAPTTPGTTGTVLCDGTTAVPVGNCTEVKMVPIDVAPANQYADWPSGIPDPVTKGPDWIQIGTEGGFLPAPAVIPSQPIGWNLNPTLFNFGTVNQHSLLLGTAERADVVVDFSAYAGKTLILYNDAPAAFPAGVPSYDYFTGVAHQMDVGGAPSTLPGYGPNTRTVMQIIVGNSVTTPTPDVTLANLNAVFAKTAAKRGVFESTQDPIIIPQAAYNSAYNVTNFPTSALAQYMQINEEQKTFRPIDAAGVLQPAVTMPLEMKAMHDEMGGVYDTQFGRMSGMLGLTNPTSPVHVLIPYGYASPPTDIHMGSVAGSQIGSFPDGTQLWRIFHNGVDSHTIHVHLFNAQLINRLGQDGVLLPPDANELGWKDTFRVNPLEITYLAMRPVIPTPAQVPFEVPNSIRLIDPTLPEGATLIPPPPAGWFDPDGVDIPEILNHYVNFGWEYVWHCHILAHEEMDMMHSLVFAVPPSAPSGLAFARLTATSINLTWTDNSVNETSFTLQRATDAGFTTGLTTVSLAANATSYNDSGMQDNQAYWYRVFASNLVGDTQAYAGSVGFPTKTADSAFSNTLPVVNGVLPAAPAAPTNLTATVLSGTQMSLTWTDNATNENGFQIERCTGVGCVNFVLIATAGPRTAAGAGSVTYVNTTVRTGNTYSYRVRAVNTAGPSAYTNTATTAVPTIPAAPTTLRVSVVNIAGPGYRADLTWASAANPTSFTLQRATNSSFTTGLATFTPAGAARALSQNVNSTTTYYYRIRANGPSGSSAWSNALPFPIRTGAE